MTCEIKTFLPARGVHVECKLEGMSMTTTHFSNSEDNHCWIWITFKWCHKKKLYLLYF